MLTPTSLKYLSTIDTHCAPNIYVIQADRGLRPVRSPELVDSVRWWDRLVLAGTQRTPGQMVASLMIADPSQAAQSSIVQLLDVPFFWLYSASAIWCNIKFDRDGRTDTYVIFYTI